MYPKRIYPGPFALEFRLVGGARGELRGPVRREAAEIRHEREKRVVQRVLVPAKKPNSQGSMRVSVLSLVSTGRSIKGTMDRSSQRALEDASFFSF